MPCYCCLRVDVLKRKSDVCRQKRVAHHERMAATGRGGVRARSQILDPRTAHAHTVRYASAKSRRTAAIFRKRFFFLPRRRCRRSAHTTTVTGEQRLSSFARPYPFCVRSALFNFKYCFVSFVFRAFVRCTRTLLRRPSDSSHRIYTTTIAATIDR